MNAEVKKKMKTILTADVSNLENITLTDEGKVKGLKAIEKEIEILHKDETHIVEMKSKRSKIRLEELKAQAQISLDNDKIKLEQDKYQTQKIFDESKLQLEEEKLEHQIQVDNAKLNLETLKFGHAQQMELDKIKLEERKIIVEEGKLALDVDKFKEDLAREHRESQEKRVDKLINIGIRLLEIGLPLAVYTSLVMKNFRLVYADDGRVPSEMRDLMKNIYKGKL